MSYINFTNNAQAGFQNALTTGMAMGEEVRQRREKRETENALATYAANPDDPKSTEALIKASPQLGYKAIEAQRERRAQQEEGDLVRRAMGGDDEATQQLAVRNFDKWKTLDARTKAQAADESKMYGNAAMDVLQLPPAQRAQAIMGYAQRFQSEEIAQIAQMPPQEQEAALRAAVAEAQMTEKLIAMERPDYQAVPYESTLVNTRDPAAVQSFLGGGTGQPGGIQEGATASNPQTGEKIQFRNGAWVPMGGGASNGAGGFPSGQ